MKKIFSAIIIGILTLHLVIGYPGVWANAANSNATVVFTPGEGPTTPVDPDDPTQPGPGDPVGGSLAIVNITDFDFGEIPYSIGAIHEPIHIDKPNLQTVDLRGVSSGWHVTAQLGQFTGSDAAPSLLGAAITITTGHPASAYDLPAPVNEPDVMLTAGSDEPSRVVSADVGAGIGLWVMRWYPDVGSEKYIHLDIPVGRAEAGAHTAEIIWTLTDGP